MGVSTPTRERPSSAFRAGPQVQGVTNPRIPGKPLVGPSYQIRAPSCSSTWLRPLEGGNEIEAHHTIHSELYYAWLMVYASGALIIKLSDPPRLGAPDAKASAHTAYFRRGSHASDCNSECRIWRRVERVITDCVRRSGGSKHLPAGRDRDTWPSPSRRSGPQRKRKNAEGSRDESRARPGVRQRAAQYPRRA
jgi:hypothetical protein